MRTMNPDELTPDEAMRAYRQAQRASDMLDDAAATLGAESVHDLGNVARDNDLPRQLDGGVKAITNAHSYLNNGGLGGLVRHFRD